MLFSSACTKFYGYYDKTLLSLRCKASIRLLPVIINYSVYSIVLTNSYAVLLFNASTVSVELVDDVH